MKIQIVFLATAYILQLYAQDGSGEEPPSSGWLPINPAIENHADFLQRLHKRPTGPRVNGTSLTAELVKLSSVTGNRWEAPGQWRTSDEHFEHGGHGLILEVDVAGRILVEVDATAYAGSLNDTSFVFVIEKDEVCNSNSAVRVDCGVVDRVSTSTCNGVAGYCKNYGRCLYSVDNGWINTHYSRSFNTLKSPREILTNRLAEVRSVVKEYFKYDKHGDWQPSGLAAKHATYTLRVHYDGRVVSYPKEGILNLIETFN